MPSFISPQKPLTQQQQLNLLIQQTIVTSNRYTDNEIHHLLNPQQKKSLQRNSDENQFTINDSDQNYRETSFGQQNGDRMKSSIDIRKLQQYHALEQIQISDHQDLSHQQLSIHDQYNQLFIDNFKEQKQKNINLSFKEQKANQSTKNKATNQSYDKLDLEVGSQVKKINSKIKMLRPYKQIYEQRLKFQTAIQQTQIQKIYPLFLTPKQLYCLQSPINERTLPFNQFLSQKTINLIDFNMDSDKVQYIALGIDGNLVLVCKLLTLQVIYTVKMFERGNMLTLRWSPNMRFLMATNDQSQVKVLQFRQLISIQSCIQQKWVSNPTSSLYLYPPKQKSPIIQIHFLSESPLKVLLIDSSYQIFLIQMKKHIIHIKPYITKLPIKFNKFNELKMVEINDPKGTVGRVLIIGGMDYVTIAVVEPNFQVILVYDKQKHFPLVQPGQQYLHIGVFNQDHNKYHLNHAYISKQNNRITNNHSNNYYNYQSSYNNFHTNQFSNQIKFFIACGQFIEVLNLKIVQISPALQYKIQTILKYTFEDESLIIGKISQTLIYQLTKDQLKIYSLNELLHVEKKNKQMRGQNSNNRKAIPILQKAINYSTMQLGGQTLNNIKSSQLPPQSFHQISHLIRTSSNHIIICNKQSFNIISINQFQQEIQNVIENVNDWKVGLQMLNDAIVGQLTTYDMIKQQHVVKLLKQYSLRYVQFLNGLLAVNSLNDANIDIWKQQIYFLLNILITCNLHTFIMSQLTIRLYRICPRFLKCFEPFILSHRLTIIQPQTLDLLLSIIDPFIGKRLIYCLGQEVDNELGHQINTILIGKGMIEEIVWINQFMGDYFTPFVVVTSLYQQSLRNINRTQLQSIKTKSSINQKQLKNQQYLILQQSTINNFKLQQSLINEVQQSPINKLKVEKQYLTKTISFLLFDLFFTINKCNYTQTSFKNQNIISKLKAKQLLETIIPLMNQKLINILIEAQNHDFFYCILDELFSKNCILLINQMNLKQTNQSNFKQANQSSKQTNESSFKQTNQMKPNQSYQNYSVLSQIIKKISLNEVRQKQREQNYWFWVIRFAINNKIAIKTDKLRIKIFPGIQYLIFHYPSQSPTLIQLINLLIQQCYDQLRQQLKSITKQKKQQIFMKLKSSNYINLIRIIGEELGREIEVIQFIICCDMAHTIQLIYYIEKQIDNLNKSTQSNKQGALKRIKDILKRNIKVLTKIDAQKTSCVIIQNYKQQMKQFIFYLQQNPSQQLYLLKNILSYYNYGQFLTDQKLKYLRLLAILNKTQEILQQLQKHMFPLDQSIDICKKYEILDAWAFLLVKSGGQGNSRLAIQIYFRIIRQNVENYRFKRRTEEKLIQLKQYLQQYLNKCISVCVDLDLKGNFHYQSEWFYIVQQLQELKKFVYRTCNPQIQHSIRQIINETLYPQLVVQLLDQVTQQNMVDYLRKQLNLLDFQAGQLIIKQMVKSYFFQKKILKTAQQQISYWQINERVQLFKQVLKGFITNNRCYQCMKRDISIKIHYNCGHDIHPQCNQDIKQCISCKFQNISLIQKQVDIKNKVEKFIYYNLKNQIIPQSQIIRLSRQQKLKKFDQALQYQI